MNHFRVQATAAFVLVGLLTMGEAQPTRVASPVHKCTDSNGEVTFQNTPCRPEEPGARPTAAQLNAERQKKLRQQAAAASSAQPAAPLAAAPQGRFKCDGRTQCSQMKSCAEATYFLTNCPDAQMDGDKNGIPCERQWCNR